MSQVTIVAHRGVTTSAPENTLAAFEEAIRLNVDAVELDVRLTRDTVPIVYHYAYLDGFTDARGPVFAYSLADLRRVAILYRGDPSRRSSISTLQEVLETIGGRIGLEIEIKGPEPEAAGAIASVFRQVRLPLDIVEVTSYEPAVLRDFQELCPGIATDLLLPLSEPWMSPDVCAYNALHRGRLARARAVHLHSSQLSSDVVSSIRHGNIDVHCWGVDDRPSLELAIELGIAKVCTDQPEEVLQLRRKLDETRS